MNEPSGPHSIRGLRREIAGLVALASMTLLALAWVNLIGDAAYVRLVSTTFSLGPLPVAASFADVVTHGLMTVFFVVVGLEIKSELTHGHLDTARKAALPLLAAAGGMAMPAAIYWLMNRSGAAAAGWAIPVATDIAFAAAVLAVFHERLPRSAASFLIALAVFDDIGGVIVIAAFYSGGIAFPWLAGAAAAALAGLFVLRRHASGVAVVAVGAALWFLFHEAGVHPALSGVVLGLLVPAEPANALKQRLRPWVTFGVVPLFAFVSAGVDVAGMHVADVTSPVFLGVVVGLVAGKLAGVLAATTIAVKARVSPLPDGMDRRSLVGVSALAGIGFTVALFIANLAFAAEPTMLLHAKAGILAGSGLAAVLGSLIIVFAP